MRIATALKSLLCLTLGLPILILVLQLARSLLSVLGDEAGAAVVRGVAIACGIVWIVSLIGLVLSLAVDAAYDEEPPEDLT